MNHPAPKPRKSPAHGSARRLNSLSLRAAMLLVAALAIWLGSVTNRARRQAEVIRALRAKGGIVYYEDQYPRGSALNRPPAEPNCPPPVPAWLRRLVGDEYFRKPVYVAWGVGPSSSGPTISDDELVRRLAALGGLKTLWLDVTGVSEKGLESVATLHDLQELRIAYCPNVTDAGIAKLQALAQLRTLGITACPITERSVRNISRIAGLETLALDFDHLAGEGLRPLKRLAHLRSLSLYSSLIAAGSLAHVEDLTQLNELQLDSPAITDATLVPIGKLHDLERLTIRGGWLTDEGLHALGALENLSELRLAPANGTFTAQSLAPLQKLTHLRHLWLGSDRSLNNQLTEYGLTNLVDAFPELQTLALEQGYLLTRPLANLRSTHPRVRIYPVPY